MDGESCGRVLVPSPVRGLPQLSVCLPVPQGLLIESVGRRPLLWGGFGAMSAIMVLITATLNLKVTSEFCGGRGLVCVCVCVCVCAIGGVWICICGPYLTLILK